VAQGFKIIKILDSDIQIFDFAQRGFGKVDPFVSDNIKINDIISILRNNCIF